MRRMILAAIHVLVFLSLAAAQTPEQKKASIAYLRGLQAPSGAFQPAAGDKQMPSLRATSSALRAVKYFGGELANKEGIQKYVHDCFDKDSGGFADQPKGKPDVFTTAVGIMAVVELKMPVDDYAPGVVKYLGENAKVFEDRRIAVAGLESIGKFPPQAKQWREQLDKAFAPDSAFAAGDVARDVGGTAVAYLRLGGKIDKADLTVTVLRRGQREDGGFGKAGADSELESTYRVMRAFHMLKGKPDADKLRAFVAKCRNDDGGYGISPGKPSAVGPTYFASIILHWLDEK